MKSHSDLEVSTVTLHRYPSIRGFALPLPDYAPGLEEPHAPPPPDFVPEPVYPKFMPPEDEVFPAGEQPMPAAVSPTADSPGYVLESDPKEDLEEDDEDPEEDPADYLSDNNDDDDEEPSKDEDDDEEEDEDEEEEHPALTDSVPPPIHRVTARMSIRAQTPISLPPRAEVERLLVLPTPPPLPLTPLSSPLPHIPSPPLPVSPPLPISPPPLPTSPTHLLGYIAVMIWLRAEAPSTSHPLPLPPPSSGVSEVTLPPRKRLCIALGPRYEVSESLSAPTARPTGGLIADYGFIGTLDDEIRRDPERAATDVAELSQRMTDFVTTVKQDTNEIYGRLDDAQDDRLLMSGRLNMLHRDRRAHARTVRLMETEARLSRKAWVQLMDASDIACFKMMALRTIVLEQQKEIAGLRAVIALQRQQGPTSGPAQPDVSEEACNST
ncbi:hypothetical protein Tco_1142900 [Tanacetum coccineum]